MHCMSSPHRVEARSALTPPTHKRGWVHPAWTYRTVSSLLYMPHPPLPLAHGHWRLSSATWPMGQGLGLATHLPTFRGVMGGVVVVQRIRSLCRGRSHGLCHSGSSAPRLDAFAGKAPVDRGSDKGLSRSHRMPLYSCNTPECLEKVNDARGAMFTRTTLTDPTARSGVGGFVGGRTRNQNPHVNTSTQNKFNAGLARPTPIPSQFWTSPIRSRQLGQPAVSIKSPRSPRLVALSQA